MCVFMCVCVYIFCNIDYVCRVKCGSVWYKKQYKIVYYISQRREYSLVVSTHSENSNYIGSCRLIIHVFTLFMAVVTSLHN